MFANRNLLTAKNFILNNSRLFSSQLLFRHDKRSQVILSRLSPAVTRMFLKPTKHRLVILTPSDKEILLNYVLTSGAMQLRFTAFKNFSKNEYVAQALNIGEHGAGVRKANINLAVSVFAQYFPAIFHEPVGQQKHTALHIIGLQSSPVDQDLLDQVKSLCPAGLVNTQDNLMNTPLHYAVSERNIRFVKWLLKQGENPYIQNNQGEDVITRFQELLDEETNPERSCDNGMFKWTLSPAPTISAVDKELLEILNNTSFGHESIVYRRGNTL